MAVPSPKYLKVEADADFYPGFGAGCEDEVDEVLGFFFGAPAFERWQFVADVCFQICMESNESEKEKDFFHFFTQMPQSQSSCITAS